MCVLIFQEVSMKVSTSTPALSVKLTLYAHSEPFIARRPEIHRFGPVSRASPKIYKQKKKNKIRTVT